MQIYVEDFGIPAEDVIRWTTANGADLALLGDKTGTTEPGKVADFIVVDGDLGANIGLLTYTSNLETIVYNGRFVKDELEALPASGAGPVQQAVAAE